ncbi:hypothetical protein C4561_04420 [candidate division WWE3 bacterium]|jgi:hypothetical protein|uniref:Uncharacterized protein n=1 Tax=candidate division WWE3 bacterium TaxID=2053526 RepID=A0A3A4ZCW0_UNCKA|nr:MAG: hypothetical protein C4561_04420 [candidate division WWE3 bacterium]
MKKWLWIALFVVVAGAASFLWYKDYQLGQQKKAEEIAAAQSRLEQEAAQFEGYKEVTLEPGSYVDTKGTAPAVANVTKIRLGTEFDGSINSLLFLGETGTTKEGLLAVYPCFSSLEQLMPGLYCEMTSDLDGIRIRYDPSRWTLTIKK